MRWVDPLPARIRQTSGRREPVLRAAPIGSAGGMSSCCSALQAAVREEVLQWNVAKLVQVEGAQYDANWGATEDQARLLLKSAKPTRL
jgi:hypothetical protein